jgi:thiol-disulfide isomerase/thioredoxin
MYLKVVSDDDASKLSNLLNDGNWMVLYYAEWCGHCNAMKPEWEKLVEKMKESKQINLADVKSDVIGKLQHKPEIEGFPTIKMYNKGQEVAKFEDERSVEKMEKFANDNVVRTTTPTTPTTGKLHTSHNNTKSSLTIPVVDMAPKRLTVKELSQIRHTEPRVSTQESQRIATNRLTLKQNAIHIEEEPKLSHHKSSIKKPVAPIKVEDLLSPKISMKSHKQSRQSKQHPNEPKQFPSLSCSEIRKAKPCKSNPKCEYDYTNYKCVNKGTAAKKSVRKSQVRKSQAQTSNIIKRNTKRVFSKLINSFSKIGNEARKDQKILKNAVNKL